MSNQSIFDGVKDGNNIFRSLVTELTENFSVMKRYFDDINELIINKKELPEELQNLRFFLPWLKRNSDIYPLSFEGYVSFQYILDFFAQNKASVQEFALKKDIPLTRFVRTLMTIMHLIGYYKDNPHFSEVDNTLSKQLEEFMDHPGIYGTKISWENEELPQELSGTQATNVWIKLKQVQSGWLVPILRPNNRTILVRNKKEIIHKEINQEKRSLINPVKGEDMLLTMLKAINEEYAQRNYQILVKRFNLDSLGIRTQKEIATDLQISMERVRQLTESSLINLGLNEEKGMEA